MMNEKTRNSQGEQPTYKKGGKTMITKMKTLMKNQKGMTLIELLAVIVIIAIIALIAIPAIGSIITNSKDKAILSDASQVISSAKIAFADGACADDSKCTGAELNPYLEKANVTLDATDDVVTKGTDGVYTLKYSGFSGLSTDSKFKSSLTGTDDDTITSDVLAEIMGNK